MVDTLMIAFTQQIKAVQLRLNDIMVSFGPIGDGANVLTLDRVRTLESFQDHVEVNGTFHSVDGISISNGQTVDVLRGVDADKLEGVKL